MEYPLKFLSLCKLKLTLFLSVGSIPWRKTLEMVDFGQVGLSWFWSWFWSYLIKSNPGRSAQSWVRPCVNVNHSDCRQPFRYQPLISILSEKTSRLSLCLWVDCRSNQGLTHLITILYIIILGTQLTIFFFFLIRLIKQTCVFSLFLSY